MPTGAARLGFWFVDPYVPVEQFPNLGFEQGLAGWTMCPYQIKLYGQTILAGWPTPNDPGPVPGAGHVQAVIQQPGYMYKLDTSDKTEETQSMHLYTGNIYLYGIVSPPGSAIYGPAVYSDFAVKFNAGDSIAFDWKAIPGSDAYSCYAYMVEQNTGAYINLVRSSGSSPMEGTPWNTEVITINTAGNYKFVFISGSWDATYGQVISGEMLVDNIRRLQP